MFRLVISDDEGKTTIIPLLRDEITIGRKEGNTIRLTERNISRRHARVARSGEKFLICDLGSYNGTLVNGERISAEHEIKSNDKILVGDYTIAIRTDVADAPLSGEEATRGLGRTSKYARLVVLGPITQGRDIDLDGYTYSIGRTGEANIDMEHPTVSPQHARLERVDNKWTIVDLDSATGLRVNGQATKEPCLLKGGDTIEAGEVRIRFVAPGEPYSFEESATAPMKRSIAAKMSPAAWKAAVITAGVVVVVALALFVALRGGEGSSPSTVPSEAPSEPQAPLETMIESAKDLMQSENWKGAVEVLGRVLKRDPANAVARDLKGTAISELDNQDLFEKGLEASSQGDWEQAYRMLSKIPPSSHYQKPGQLDQARDKLFDKWGKAVVEFWSAGDNEAAKVQLAALRTIEGLSPRQMTRIEEIAKRIAGQPEAAAPAEHASEKGSVAPNPYETPKEHASRKPKNPYESAASPVQPEHAAAAKLSPMDQAREKLIAGDQAGAIKILEKGGSSKPVLNLLAATYMAVKDRDGYLKTIKKYAKLYPDDPKSEQYKTILESSGH